MALLLPTHTMFDHLGLVTWPRVCQKHTLQILSCSILVRSTLNLYIHEHEHDHELYCALCSTELYLTYIVNTLFIMVLYLNVSSLGVIAIVVCNQQASGPSRPIPINFNLLTRNISYFPTG